MSPTLKTAAVPKRKMPTVYNLPAGRILRSFCERIGWCVCDSVVTTPNPAQQQAARVLQHRVYTKSAAGDDVLVSNEKLPVIKTPPGMPLRKASTPLRNVHQDSGLSSYAGLSSPASSSARGGSKTATNTTTLSNESLTNSPSANQRKNNGQSSSKSRSRNNVITINSRTNINVRRNRSWMQMLLLSVIVLSIILVAWKTAATHDGIYDDNLDSSLDGNLRMNMTPGVDIPPQHRSQQLAGRNCDSSIQTGSIQQLQKDLDKLDGQVKDLAKRTEKCTSEQITRDRHRSKEHEKLQAQLDSLKSVTEARFEKQSVQLRRLEQTASALNGRCGQFVRSAGQQGSTVEADQLPDYALKSGGAAVLLAHNGNCGLTSWWQRWQRWWRQLPDPETIISGPSGLQPGDCWSFAGFPGRAVVQLSRPIRVSAVSIDHISRLQSFNNSVASAPKRFCVYGLTKACDFKTGRRLGCFAYDAESGPPTQTFHIVDSEAAMESAVFKYVLLEVGNNHGQPDYTCVYRFRVHGHM
ncbi:hypothetical protein BOX15_Mlig015518g3 [Macrostomum lignano]|uniref:SUN domain-containing protein n=1 Tax=Macrostomum lignano TaxID=282301 RepID=A0A267H0X3_9PLAT|nr:hypothetical protein BOX15_Mlig015518g3 [Macrostomum lignano]